MTGGGGNQCSVKSKVTQRQIALTGRSKGDKHSSFALATLIKGRNSTWRHGDKGERAAVLLFSFSRTNALLSVVIRACLPGSLR